MVALEDIYVFLGPSLPKDRAELILPANYLPPVAEGDILRLLKHKPAVVAVVDGYFDSTPAVWHKELLWALDHGVQLYGAASMGALRATELERFGMVGVGEVFDDYLSGRLCDDDEVAVAHLLEEGDHRPLSEAMVNIRKTLKLAVDSQVISSDIGRQLTAIAKGFFYPDRSYQRLLDTAVSEAIITNSSAAELKDWLERNAIDQKAEDALTLLKMLKQLVGKKQGQTGLKDASFRHTTYFQRALQRAALTEIADSLEVDYQLVLDELLLKVEFFNQVAARVLAVTGQGEELVLRQRALPDLYERFTVEYCWRHQLLSDDAFEQWLSRCGLTAHSFAESMQRGCNTQLAATAAVKAMPSEAVDAMMILGLLPELIERAKAKSVALESKESGDQSSLAEAELIDRFCVSNDLALSDNTASLAQLHGFMNEAHLLRVLSAEHRFTQLLS